MNYNVNIAITLPNQSITEDKSNEITNSRNLTLNELLSQLKHYSPGMRKGKGCLFDVIYLSFISMSRSLFINFIKTFKI